MGKTIEIKEIKEVVRDVDVKEFIRVLLGTPGKPYANQLEREKYLKYFNHLMQGHMDSMINCFFYQIICNGYGHLKALKTRHGEITVDEKFLNKLIKIHTK